MSAGSTAESGKPAIAWLCALSLCYYAAVTIGDTVAQSVFLSRLGAGALPMIFLLKAGIDVISGILYLPLTRGRSPRSVWRAILGLYVLIVAVGWWASTSGNSDLGAYVLYAGHEVAWTLAVIHWGVFLLDVFSPSESRRLFPVLFGVGRLGALLGGLVVGGLALTVGAENLLGLAILLALFAIVLSTRLGTPAPTTQTEDSAGRARRAAWGSPLVKLIALSTATMVMLRYGLRMVSLDEIRSSFDGDKDQVAAFLGLFSVVGNALAFVLGLYVVPKILKRFNVGIANLAYASATVFAFLLTWLAPGLATASAARFVEMPLKHSLKTPLSVLFYGAENLRIRIAARSLIFGIVIPIATVGAALCFRSLRTHIWLISASGVVLALLYLSICAWQNRCYRERLGHLLREELEKASVDSERQSEWLTKLREIAPSLAESTQGLVARAFAAHDESIRSLALVFLSEQLPHRLFSDIQNARV